MVKVLESDMKEVLFKSDEVYMNDFTDNLTKLFEGGIAQEEAKLLGRYLFEPRVFYQVEDINRIEKAKFIETRLRKFVGQYEVVSDSIAKTLKEFIQKPENKQKKTELIEKINEVK